jgi:NADPH:quinone reductase-like Zn-dependent oxidoreductase
MEESLEMIMTARRPLMRATVYDDYGDAGVLRRSFLPVPEKERDELLIEVHAASVNPIDYRLRSGEMKRLLPGGFPRIPGYDVAGIVAEGDQTGLFQPGDRVMAFLDSLHGGACADFAVCGADFAAKIPDNMPFEHAAAMPLAGTTALQSLRDHGHIQPGHRVLINGASGGVGAFAIQIAKSYSCFVGAVASEANRKFCLSLGADQFYDYEKTDFTESGELWNIVFDAAGKSGYWDSRPVLLDGGRYVSTEPDVQGMLMTIFTYPLSKSGKVMLAKPSGDDLRSLIELYSQGKLKVTLDSTYPMSDASSAHRRIEAGVSRGKVVLVNNIP